MRLSTLYTWAVFDSVVTAAYLGYIWRLLRNDRSAE